MPRASLLAVCLLSFHAASLPLASAPDEAGADRCARALVQDDKSENADEQAGRAAARLDELQEEFSRIQMALLERFQAAESEGERAKVPDYNLAPWAEIKPRVVAAAKEFAGTPGAVPFLLWTVGASGRAGEHAEAIAAMETLLEQHPGDERIIDVAGSLHWYRGSLGLERALELASAFEAAADDDETKAAFRFAGIRVERPEGDALTEALAALVARYPGTKAAASAAGWKFEVERLQVGMTVPELTGTTLAGGEFRLSEHRGKVVVLEFWGVNCGPCIQKMPRSAARVRRLADAPFLHVGIQSCDGTREAVEEITEAHGVRWPIVLDRAVDGSPFGPIGTKWHLGGWPTVFLIDHEGVIRSNWATEAVLEEMLPGLIERARE